jgi:hypothetical protein
MRAEAPRSWRWTDPLLDALDHTFIVTRSTTTPWISVVISAAALLGLRYLWRKGKRPKQALMLSILTGIAMALAHAIYVLLRISHVTVTSKPVAVGPVDIVLTALLASCGAAIYAARGSLPRRIAGVLVAVLPSAGAAVVSFVFLFVFNTSYARPALGTGIYNYSMTLMALAGTACQAVVFFLLVFLLRRLRSH